MLLLETGTMPCPPPDTNTILEQGHAKLVIGQDNIAIFDKSRPEDPPAFSGTVDVLLDLVYEVDTLADKLANQQNWNPGMYR